MLSAMQFDAEAARWTTAVILSIALGASLAIALWGRLKSGKGIGWQFVRFTTILTSVMVTAILALTGALSEGIVAILASALAYAFGKAGDGEKPDA